MPNPDSVRDPKQPARGIDLTTPEAEASVQEGTHNLSHCTLVKYVTHHWIFHRFRDSMVECVPHLH
jgi:hypothetical protein